MQEQKRMRELQEREEQKALFTEKIARQMFEAEVGVPYCYIIIYFCVSIIIEQVQNFLILCV
jgi:uncharacterized membrane protein